MTTTDVDNWPADAMGVQGPELMERFLKHAERFETEIIFDHIHTAKLTEKPITLVGDQRHLHLRRAHHRDRRLGDVPGPRRPSRRSWARACRAAPPATASSTRARTCAVVGGGNTAVEEALYLTNIAKHVTVIHRRDKFRAEKILQDKLFAEAARGQGRRSCGTTTLDEVLGDKSRRDRRAREVHATTARTEELKVTGCFIAIGHKPNTDIFAGQLEMKDGYIVTKSGLDGQRHRDQRPGRVRRGRRAGPRLPPGGHQRGHRLHGGARRRQVPGRSRVKLPAGAATRPPDRRDERRHSLFREAVARRAADRAPRTASSPSARLPAPCPSKRLEDERAVLDELAHARPRRRRRRDRGRRGCSCAPGLPRDILRKLRRTPLGDPGRRSTCTASPATRPRSRPRSSSPSASARGVRCVRIVHGKGLRSRGREPVLKRAHPQAAARGATRCSPSSSRARSHGGGGAVVVLLRG